MNSQITNYVYVAESLDGFIAEAEGGMDWLDVIPPSEEVDESFRAFIQKVDAVVMGRRTFETVQGFGVWPYDKPVVVLSRSLEALPEEFAGKARVSAKGIESLLAELSEQGLQKLYIDGGKVIQSFLDMDLIDEMIIARVPVLLGEGITLFGKRKRMIQFEHIVTTTLINGLTMSTYRRNRS